MPELLHAELVSFRVGHRDVVAAGLVDLVQRDGAEPVEPFDLAVASIGPDVDVEVNAVLGGLRLRVALEHWSGDDGPGIRTAMADLGLGDETVDR